MLRTRTVYLLLASSVLILRPDGAMAQTAGQEDFDEAMRAKVTAEDLNDLNEVIRLLESAIQKGLDEQNTQFAKEMLNDALIERASGLLDVLNRVPPERVAEDEAFREQVRQMSGRIIIDLRQVLASDDPPGLAKFLMGQLLLKFGGDRNEAKDLLDQFITEIEQAEESDLPPVQIAEAYMLRAALNRDAEKAIEDVSRAIELNGDATKYRLARAALYGAQQNLEKALEDVEAVIEMEPNDETGYLVQAEIYQAQGQIEDAMESLDKASEAAPDAWKPYQYRGQLLRAQGDLEGAIQQFTKALEKDPELPDTLLARASLYMESGDFEDAAADVEEALSQRPGWVTALRLKAQLLASTGELSAAIDELKKVVDAGADAPEIRLQLALYYLVDEKPRPAIEQYSQVLEEDADNVDALRHRGDGYISIGDHRRAMADFETALKLSPDDSTLLNNLAWLLASSPDDDLRNGDRAVELATRASELTEYKQAFILSTLAAAYAEAGDFEKARQWSQKAVEMNDREDQAEQLANELESYKLGKPWRERQTIGDDEEGSQDDAVSDKIDEQPAQQSIDF